MDFRSPAPSSARLRWRGSRQLPEGIPVVVDGLALGALPEAAEKIARRAPLVALVHHPLALEAGLSLRRRPQVVRKRAQGAGRCALGHRHQSGHREAAERGLRRSPGAHHRRAARHRSRSTRQRKRRRHSPAFVGRGRRAAQGLRRFDRCARVDPRTAVAADDRGRSHTLAADGVQASSRHRTAPTRRSCRSCSEQSRRRSWPRCIPRPMFSCWHRTSRAMAWPTRRRWRTVCRS